MSTSDSEKLACLQALTAVAQLDGDPTPAEFEAFLAALSTFQPLPVGVTPEGLLSDRPAIDPWLPAIQTPALQQQVYRGACAIARSKGINPQEAALLKQLQTAFQLSPELAHTLAKQSLPAQPAQGMMASALVGIAALIGREGEVRRLILDYALGAAIVGLIPFRGGGTLELKLVVVLGLILKMIWDIRQLWGKPQGQDVLAVVGNLFGFVAAVITGLLAWATLIGLGVVVPYVAAFSRAAGFATATWVAGQATNQFYTSAKRPDLAALRRAFPGLAGSAPSDR